MNSLHLLNNPVSTAFPKTAQLNSVSNSPKAEENLALTHRKNPLASRREAQSHFLAAFPDPASGVPPGAGGAQPSVPEGRPQTSLQAGVIPSSSSSTQTSGSYRHRTTANGAGDRGENGPEFCPPPRHRGHRTQGGALTGPLLLLLLLRGRWQLLHVLGASLRPARVTSA